MSLRTPDTEALEDAIRVASNDLNGYVNLPEQRSFIQSEYAEKRSGRLNASEVSHDDIRQALNEFADDSQKDIQHVNGEVYFVNPFSASPGEDKEIINRIEETYRVHIVFSGETLRRTFDLPMDHAEYFIDSLVDRDLLQRLSRTHDVYTIGSQLEQQSNELGISERLAKEATHGVITNDKMETIVDSPVIPAVTTMFENDGYILDLDGEFLVLSALEDFQSHLANQIESDIRAEFDGAVLLESAFENAVENYLSHHSERLSRISKADTRSSIVEGVKDTLRENLGIESREADGSSIVVMTDDLEDTVQEKADTIYPRVSDQTHATARAYYEAAEEEVESISTDSGALVNEYLRKAVLDEVWARVQTELFNRDEPEISAED